MVMEQLLRIKRMNTAEAVVAALKEKILRGDLKPGESLPSERSLIEQFGISRLSLREGLARLAALGIITVRHGKGAVISETVRLESLQDVFVPALLTPNTKSFSDLLEARRVLEAALARMAAAKRTPEDLETLETILHRTESALDDPESFAVEDSAFHRAVGRIADNSLLLAMEDIIYSQVESFIASNVREPESRDKALTEHREVFRAVRSGDPEEAADAIIRHLLDCEKSYLEGFARRARPGSSATA